MTDMVHTVWIVGDSAHVETDDRLIDLINLPQFAVPGDITPDLPLRTSPEARTLLIKAVGLCRPRRAGFVLGGEAKHELRGLARACRALLAARNSEDSPAEAILDEQERDFDRFFGLARSRSPDAFVVGIVWGIIATLEEISHPNTLVPAEMAALAGGFYQLAKPFLESFDGEGTLEGRQEDEATLIRHPMERWRNGHLAFVALTGGLIFAHVRAIAAIEGGDFAHARAALSDVSSLFFASAAAMRLTGDMSAEDYEGVRSIMSPPQVPDGFSGLFNCDHRHLLRLTRKLGLLLSGDLPEIDWERENYWMALNAAYSAHRGVCRELVGRAPSLATVSKEQEKPAYEMLEGFAKRALFLSGYAKRLKRLPGTRG